MVVFHRHVAVLAFPFGTHAAPLLALATRLADAAPATRFSFLSTAASHAATIPAALPENVRAYDVWDGAPPGAPQVSHFEAIAQFLEASPANFEDAIEAAERDAGLAVTCVVGDAFLWFGGDLAEKRGVPWVAFWTAASCSLSAHLYTDEFVRAVGSAEKQDELLSFIPPGFPKLTLADLPPEIFLDKNPSPLSLTIDNMLRHLPKSAAVVLNSFEEIDPAITDDLNSKFLRFLNVGPSILAGPTPPPPDDATGCLPWLDRQSRSQSVVYISFGTVIVPPPQELAAIAAALEVCQLPFLWSLKDAARKSLPDGFLGRADGKVVAWAPQPRVLAHGAVGAFVTHCGWNSVVESIAAGVPLVCRPFFGDQRLNARMVEDSWRIGVGVHGGAFGDALRRVTAGEEAEAMRENVRRLRMKALEAVKPEGSSGRNLKKLVEIVTGSGIAN